MACGGPGGAPRLPADPSPHPPRSGVCQAACGAGRSPRAGLELGVGGVAAPSAGSSRAGFSPVLAPMPAVPPICRPGLPRGTRICDLVLSGSGGGESGTGPLPPTVSLQASGQLLGTGTEARGLCLLYNHYFLIALGVLTRLRDLPSGPGKALDVSHRWHGSRGAPLSASGSRSGFSANGRTDLELRILLRAHFQVCLCQEVAPPAPFLNLSLGEWNRLYKIFHTSALT